MSPVGSFSETDPNWTLVVSLVYTLHVDWTLEVSLVHTLHVDWTLVVSLVYTLHFLDQGLVQPRCQMLSEHKTNLHQKNRFII